MSGLLLVHAVMCSDQSLPAMLSTIEGAVLDIVENGDLKALVSILPAGADQTLFADPDKAADFAVRHHAMLTSLAANHDIAPVRLGAVYATKSAVSDMLAESNESFRQALAHITGAVEFAMKLTPVTVMQTEPVQESLTGRGFLQRRADSAAAQRNRADRARQIATDVFEQVVKQAKDHAFISPRRNAQADQEKRLLDAALLVPRSHFALFERAVTEAQALAEAQGYRLTVAGPLPAYSFVAKPPEPELAA